jgi:PAS domain S-box-containing protein
MAAMKVDALHITSLFENSTEGIVVTNSEGNIILINPAGQRMFGYDVDEIIGKSIEILLPERVHRIHTQLRKEFYHHPQNRVMGHGRDLYGKRKDNSEIPVEVSLSFYKRSEELFVVAFIVDITRRKQIENNMRQQQKELEKLTTDMRRLNTDLEAKVEERTLILKEALQRLEESQEELSAALNKEKELNEIKSSFVSMASHEFRTPLSTVLSSASLISKYTQTEDQDKRNRHIKRIKDSVKHLNNLLEDFLSLGRLEEGKIQVNVESFEVKEFLEEVVEELKASTKQGQQIQIENTVEVPVVTDRRLLKNILINLLSNAVKFSAEHTCVRMAAMRIDNKLVISVKDEGMGISEEDQQHLFSSFFRGKNVINIQGTGLGLHIVKRYADLIHAEVRLKSQLGTGTIVTIELPNLSEANYR